MSEALGALLLIIGAGFMAVAGVGVVRMPDLFMRMQASAKATTLGSVCMLLAVAVHFGDGAVAVRSLLIIAFIFLTAPVAAAMIARAAYAVRAPLWEGTITDELREVFRRYQPEREEEALLEPPPPSESGAQEPNGDRPAGPQA